MSDILSDAIYLTDEELKKLNDNANKHKLQKYEDDILLLKKRLIEAEQATLKAKLDTLTYRLQLADYHILQSTRSRRLLKEHNKELIESIREKYDIPDGITFGYDPDSGELIIN
jgi:hypothetical protein